MSALEFTATGPPSAVRPKPPHPPARSKIVLWALAATAAVIYSTANPGQITITAENMSWDSTKGRSIAIRGSVDNPRITSVLLSANGASQTVPVDAKGKFTALVPLTGDDSLIQASVEGTAANLVRGSNLIRSHSTIQHREQLPSVAFHCEGQPDPPGWTCEVHNLNGARIGSTLILSMETLQSGQKRMESLTCGPVSESHDASCKGSLRGVPFQGNQVSERLMSESGESWEVSQLGTCTPGPVTDGQSCGQP